tara:strand:+ start:54 stop:749 length:696 start_codon:yes stop_codon:yes gene_type:complete
MEINKSKFSTYKDIKNYFEENKIKNVILFSQARSGSTFATDFLSNYLKFEKKNIYPENYFLNRHFSYLREFVKKHDNFFLNINTFVYRRIDIKKDSTLFIYLYRDSKEILGSYEKAKKLNYYLGWEEFYNRYRKFYPDIDSSVSIPEFNHIVWQKQINTFNHAKTLSYKSLKDAPNYLENRSQITKMKQINLSENEYIPDMKNKINFSIFERFNLFLQEKLDRKKKSIKNY